MGATTSLSSLPPVTVPTSLDCGDVQALPDADKAKAYACFHEAFLAVRVGAHLTKHGTGIESGGAATLRWEVTAPRTIRAVTSSSDVSGQIDVCTAMKPDFLHGSWFPSDCRVT